MTRTEREGVKKRISEQKRLEGREKEKRNKERNKKKRKRVDV